MSTGSTLPTVYAYRDNGCMLALCRWKPRRVFCTSLANHSDLPGEEYVVKFAQGEAGTAALISEVVCSRLLAAGGVSVLEPSIVIASSTFAFSSSPAILPGSYFGTRLQTDVANGPPPSLAYVARPQEIIDIWAFDSWLCNIDRNTEGNLLLVREQGSQFGLIAVDQSDCFGGSTRIADESWKTVLARDAPAESVAFLDTAIYDKGAAAVRSAISKVRDAAKHLSQALAVVPEIWWRQVSKMRPSDLHVALDARARRMESILDLKKWEGLDDAIRGGYIL